MPKIMFRHITGSRATEVDVVDLGAHRELVLGRARSAAVRFDPLYDREVGRHHARISWNDAVPVVFEICDLKSRNGTYVNGRLITTPMRLQVGDVIQLGAQGPEIEVRWDAATTTVLHLIG
ncbi:MAG: FHA domain-containing protein [Gemmatimonadota bacterium]|nr:FHA domain-containing protein [Gemmatimonadota bacterium]